MLLLFSGDVSLSIGSDHGTEYWVVTSQLGAADSYPVIQLRPNNEWTDGTARRNDGRKKFICEYSMYV